MTRPIQSNFAEPALSAKWMPVLNEQDTIARTGPMLIEWRKKKVQLADFFWPGALFDLLARKEIAEELVNTFGGARLIDVRITSGGKNQGTDYWKNNPYSVVWIDHWVQLDPKVSTIINGATEAGRPSIEIVGIEHYSYHGLLGRPTLDEGSASAGNVYTRHYRRVDHGVFVPRSQLLEKQLFRLTSFPGFLMCTDPVKQFILDRSYTNIEFLEYGETL